MVFVCVGDRPTSSSSALLADSRRRPSSTSAPRAMHECSVNSAAKSAASLDGGSDPVDRAPIATRWSPSATFSLRFARLRLRRGGDQPNLTIIDNDIASHGIAATTPFDVVENQRTIRAELTVLFQPFQLYEFPVIRRWAMEHLLSSVRVEE